MKYNEKNDVCRCSWATNVVDIYVKYHDEEWGVPAHDDRFLFEMLVLESFQAGLSWLTVLKKREAFRRLFDNFDVNLVSKYDDVKIDQLLSSKDIIRNRRKIEAAINNAKVFIDISNEFGSFDKYIWKFTDGKTINNKDNKLRCSSPLSDEIAKDLKKRGMKFVGTVTIYSYIQAIGIVNDHDTNCFRWKQLYSD